MAKDLQGQTQAAFGPTTSAVCSGLGERLEVGGLSRRCIASAPPLARQKSHRRTAFCFLKGVQNGSPGNYRSPSSRSAQRRAHLGMGTPFSLVYCVIVPQAMRSPALPAGSVFMSSALA
jgi:hypothetical protein